MSKKSKDNEEKQKKPEKIGNEYSFEGFILNKTDKQVLTLKLEGKSNNDIAKELNKTYQTISVICNKPEFIRAFDTFYKTYLQIILDNRIKAVNKVIEHIDSTNPVVSIRACEDIVQFDKIERTEQSDNDNGVEFKGWNDN